MDMKLGIKGMPEALKGCGKEIQCLLENIPEVEGFMSLVGRFGSFPNIAKRPSDKSRSLIEVVSKGRDVKVLESELGTFFTSVTKPAGKAIPFMLRFSPVAKYLGGVRKEQSFYTKKSGAGEFYAALWPWQSTPENVTVHFGYFSKTMPDEDYQKLRNFVGNLGFLD